MVTDEERLFWVDAIQNARTQLMSRQIGSQNVAELTSKIIARAREGIGDTVWMEYALQGVLVGLNWNGRELCVTDRTSVGLLLALSSAEISMVPIEDLSPECCVPSGNIDTMIAAGKSVGVTDYR